MNPVCYRLCFPVPASRPVRYRPPHRASVDLCARLDRPAPTPGNPLASWCRSSSTFSIPQDYPARAHMQGLKRGVPVVSIPDAKPTGLVLDKEPRIRLHVTESCRQSGEACHPPVHRLAIRHLRLRAARAFQLLEPDPKRAAPESLLQGQAFREGCVLARTVQVAVNPRFKGTAIRRGSRRSKISNHTNLNSMLSATPHRMSPLLESPAEYVRAAAPHGRADSRGSLGRR